MVNDCYGDLSTAMVVEVSLDALRFRDSLLVRLGARPVRFSVSNESNGPYLRNSLPDFERVFDTMCGVDSREESMHYERAPCFRT